MAADPDDLGIAYEAALTPGQRRRLGAHYTPPALADELVALALAHTDEPQPVVCDPACGGGAFLLAAGRLLARRGLKPAAIATDLLWGCDLDPAAVVVAGNAIEAWAGVRPPADHLRVADGLTVPWTARFDVVVGNPPFLNQLERATVRRRALPPALAALAGPYTDTAWLFLVAGVDLAKRAGGVVVLLQPQSVAAARDAAPVRAAVDRRAAVSHLWSTADRPFAASVHVCAPVLVTGAGDGDGDGDGTRSSWASRLARPDPAPAVELPTTTGTLADLASATAGFRDEYYGLVPFVTEGGDGPWLVTSGLIDVGGCAWGVRRVRFAKRQWREPRVDLVSLGRDDPKVAQWVRGRLLPKVVVATQTKVIEAAVDERGEWVPSTPVVSVEPFVSADVWSIAAVLLAPPVSAWVSRAYAGTALSPTAIKLSASQVCRLPLPSNPAAWSAGAASLRRGEVKVAAALMNHAYGADDEVLAWWNRRVP